MCSGSPQWTLQHLVDRFMWLEGVVGIAQAHSSGEEHGYLTFQTYRQEVAASTVVNAALGTLAPALGKCRR